ncbi:uncharacterized protein LOC116289987 [Actinia tenebrosa]|uniref:Uncharacterized protein LOC116289987 n=1 Tax=Actinia tenebrosa TaxID=6105 RepID=A0A6P8HJF4_ACTTE|nr:uncharacterized protein LOC116289987 [Actinia tenebrosa]
MAVVVGTWSFSKRALEVIAEELTNGQSYIDGLEKGINAVEDDPKTGPYLVGRGGYPNSSGILECDAGIVVGEGCQFGAVAGLQGVAVPFSVARLVLEKCPHSMVTGNGAKDFAQAHGITIENQDTLLTSKSLNEMQNYKTKNDTIGVIVLDDAGHLAAGVSSSGMPCKLPGRVGDSPLPGSGLYADNEIGAAVASGDGDKMMRFCPSFYAVRLIKQGFSPQQACEVVVRESQRKAGTTDRPF